MFSYDWSTNPTLAQIRLMVFDTTNTEPGTPIWQDEELMGVLQVCSSTNIIVGLSGYTLAVPVTQIFSFGRAAAMLLNGLAADKGRMAVAGLLDAKMNFQQASAALKAIAQQYIDQEVSAGYFAISEMVQDPFSMRERLWKQLYRQGT